MRIFDIKKVEHGPQGAKHTGTTRCKGKRALKAYLELQLNRTVRKTEIATLIHCKTLTVVYGSQTDFVLET